MFVFTFSSEQIQRVYARTHRQQVYVEKERVLSRRNFSELVERDLGFDRGSRFPSASQLLELVAKFECRYKGEVR